MRLGRLVAIILVLVPTWAAAIEVNGHVSAGGWFFGIDGTIEETDLDALDFDSIQGQPELEAGVTLGRRHHLDVSYLLIRRSEEGTAQGEVLGIVIFEDDVSIDLDVDYVRGHYGFSLVMNDWIDLEPFLEVGFLREATDIRNRTTGQREKQDDFAVFPLPGLAVAIAPAFPIGLEARATGIGLGQGHLIDVEGGAEGRFGFVFLGVGYRYVDFRFEDGDREVADLELSGVYVRGGARF